jgi:hypothetical protein
MILFLGAGIELTAFVNFVDIKNSITALFLFQSVFHQQQNDGISEYQSIYILSRQKTLDDLLPIIFSSLYQQAYSYFNI